MPRSLRGRLFFGLTTVIVLTGCVAGVFAYGWAYDEAIEMQDSVLTQISAFAFTNSSMRLPVDGVDAEAEVAVVELDAAPSASRDDRRLWSLADGLHDDVWKGRPVRLMVRTRPQGSRFAVMQRTDIRNEIAGDTAVHTLLPIALLIPCLLLVVAVVITRSFRPMIRLAHDFDTRRADDMRELPMADAPGELHPFLGSINGLLARMRVMMGQQRRFIADAAHELRTPITALGLQAENLDPVGIPEDARGRVDTLKDGIRRIRHLLEQLLSLARQDAPEEDTGWVALDRIAKDVVANLLPEAAATGIDLGFAMAEPVSLKASPVALASLIRNLVENAVRFTPTNGRVDIRIHREDNSAVFEVEDTGPGIPESDIDRIFEPFVRGRGQAAEGSGLGLSIVKRIVDRYGGAITLEQAPAAGRSGLRVTVRLPIEPEGPR